MEPDLNQAVNRTRGHVPGRSMLTVFALSFALVNCGGGGSDSGSASSSSSAASTPSNGSCGSADGISVATAPASSLCSAGAASSVATGTDSFTWSCTGSNGGTTAQCSAPIASTAVSSDGVCGSANGTSSATAPSSNLCTAGTASSVATGTSSYTWSCAGSNGGAAAQCSASIAVSTPTGTQDFASRCAQPGVIKCVGFDDASDFSTGSGGQNGAYGFNAGIIPPSGTSDYSRAVQDSSVKASGASALKFTIPAVAAADTSGAYFTNFSTDLSTQFGAGQEFYVQWRQRFSPEFIANQYAGGGGFKQAILGSGDQPGTTYSSCSALELVVMNYLQNGFPAMYNSCTGSTSHGPYDGFYEPYGQYDFKLQNARPAPGCLYSQSSTGYFPPNGNCFGYVANEWMTFQEHVTLGPRVGDEFQNSTIELWVAREGQPSELVIQWGPYNVSAGSLAENQRYGKVWLLPYNTGKNTSQSYPVAYTWYDELIISQNRIADPAIIPAESDMPAWRQGMAVGEWRQIANSAMSSAPIAVTTYPPLGNGPNAKVVAWTGFSIDTRDSSVYSAANGGHSDYAGNEVDRIRLTDDAPVWTEPRAATPAAQVIANATHYADGRPTSRHSYYGSVFNEVRGRAMTFSGSRYGDGFLTTAVDGFDPAAGDWDAANTYPDVPSAFYNSQAGGLALDKSSGDVYTFANWSIDRWSSASNTWSNMISNSSVYGQGAATAYDTRRNRILLVGGNNNEHSYYDVATNTTQSVTFSGAGAAALTGTGNALVYEPLLDAFLFRTPDAGATVYRINAQDFSVGTLTTAGGTQIPAAPNGVWTRFLYVPQLKGIAYVPTYSDGLWFLRTY